MHKLQEQVFTMIDIFHSLRDLTTHIKLVRKSEELDVNLDIDIEDTLYIVTCYTHMTMYTAITHAVKDVYVCNHVKVYHDSI